MATISVNLFQPPIRNRSSNRFFSPYLRSKVFTEKEFSPLGPLTVDQWVGTERVIPYFLVVQPSPHETAKMPQEHGDEAMDGEDVDTPDLGAKGGNK